MGKELGWKDRRTVTSLLLVAILIFAFSTQTVRANVGGMDHIRGMYITRVYVEIVGGNRYWFDMKNQYDDEFLLAEFWWVLEGMPWDIVEDGGVFGDSYNSIWEFLDWWENHPAERKGHIYILDGERHEEYWWGGYKIYWGGSTGNICCDKDFSAYLYARAWNPETKEIYDIPEAWHLTNVKKAIGHGVHMGGCWYGDLGFYDCLCCMTRFHPRDCVDLCWLCENAWNGIKSNHGW